MAYRLHRKPHNTLILYQMVTLCQFKKVDYITFRNTIQIYPYYFCCFANCFLKIIRYNKDTDKV